MSETADRITQARERVNSDPRAGTRRGSHTMQVRYIVAALSAIGVKRSDYRARVTYERDGTYGYAMGTPRTPEARQLIRDHADELAEYGLLRVHLGPNYAFVATTSEPGVRRHGATP